MAFQLPPVPFMTRLALAQRHWDDLTTYVPSNSGLADSAYGNAKLERKRLDSPLDFEGQPIAPQELFAHSKTHQFRLPQCFHSSKTTYPPVAPFQRTGAPSIRGTNLRIVNISRLMDDHECMNFTTYERNDVVLEEQRDGTAIVFDETRMEISPNNLSAKEATLVTDLWSNVDNSALDVSAEMPRDGDNNDRKAWTNWAPLPSPLTGGDLCHLCQGECKIKDQHSMWFGGIVAALDNGPLDEGTGHGQREDSPSTDASSDVYTSSDDGIPELVSPSIDGKSTANSDPTDINESSSPTDGLLRATKALREMTDTLTEQMAKFLLTLPNPATVNASSATPVFGRRGRTMLRQQRHRFTSLSIDSISSRQRPLREPEHQTPPSTPDTEPSGGSACDLTCPFCFPPANERPDTWATGELNLIEDVE
ncbi:hypothetical protein B0H16DRAFT_1469456 [Mycena metata]|uniref:Uncharacterized protein n=1 Tax=Mycena metata TaxID=1033252 RepID=A0AAD7MT40_9AGAR|nr:hypothetical protein B0H16DRAFT_1469456 [Mycena metata]